MENAFYREEDSDSPETHLCLAMTSQPLKRRRCLSLVLGPWVSTMGLWRIGSPCWLGRSSCRSSFWRDAADARLFLGRVGEE